MIVGESLIGVVLAAIVVFSGTGTPLALVGGGFADAAMWVGGCAFLLLGLGLDGWLNRLGNKA